jgi:hypothetical protein
MLLYSYAELRRPPAAKDAYFDAYAVLVGVPVGIVGWMEALACDAFVLSLGGHVVYDTTISLSIVAYGCVARGRWLDGAKPKVS